MEVKIALEWNDDIGISLTEMYPLREGIELFLRDKTYGDDLAMIWIILIGRLHDFKLRKRYVKAARRLGFDILLDFHAIKILNTKEAKIHAIKHGFMEGLTKVLPAYKHLDFRQDELINDLDTFFRQTEIP